MLVHFFWLLEFKFKFEFHCLNPFQTQNQNSQTLLLSLPYPFLFQPTGLRSPARSQPAARTRLTRQPS
jgi:hypothetical protein